MLKSLAPAVFCLFILLFACEPNGSESLEPVPGEEPTVSTGKEEAGSGDPSVEIDSDAALALAEVNTWRQQGCKCGEETMPPTSKVTWSAELYAAALAHAKDMHTNDYFSHTSPTGENVYHRLVKAGYINSSIEVSAYGENIAFGNFDLKAAVQKWLESPSHCANVMRGSYREMAVAHDGNYWVQVFGAIRN